MRRLGALLSGLPVDSALARAVIGDSWSNDTALLAVIADRLGVVASEKHRLKAPPEPIKRPDGLQPEPKKASTADVLAFFGGAG